MDKENENQELEMQTKAVDDKKGPKSEPTGFYYIRPQHRDIHDHTVAFEEYHYYAQQSREEEKTFESPKLVWSEVLLRKKDERDVRENAMTSVRELTEEDLSNPSHRLKITDEEWVNASRAFRTTSWGACECVS